MLARFAAALLLAIFGVHAAPAQPPLNQPPLDPPPPAQPVTQPTEPVPALTPTRRYFGVGQPLTLSTRGLTALSLHRLADGSQLAKATLPKGDEVDLLTIFEALRVQNGPARALLVQGWAATGPVGPPLVVQPMRTPERVRYVDPATLAVTGDRSRGVPMFESKRRRLLAERGLTPPPAEPRTFSGFRVYALADVVFSTTLGEVRFRLRPDEAPNTCYRFMDLVEGGFYTALPFHHIVTGPGRRFVAQTGDPTGTGFGGSGEWFDLEPSELPHRYGVLSVARWDDPDAGGSQVFVCLGDDGLGSLDGAYTAFAEAIVGVGTI